MIADSWREDEFWTFIFIITWRHILEQLEAWFKEMRGCVKLERTWVVSAGVYTVVWYTGRSTSRYSVYFSTGSTQSIRIV